MIIIRLQGGLGNQLFQYALGEALSRNNLVKYDVSFFDNPSFTARQLHLQHFKTNLNLAAPEEVAAFFRPRSHRLIRKGLNLITPLHMKTRFHESPADSYRFKSGILNLRHSIYLDGYWQNELYFSGISKKIRHKYTLLEPLKGSSLQKILKSPQAVAIHIRRGDYVKLGVALSLDYYLRAIEKIKCRLEHPSFFCFSDDIEFVKQNLPATIHESMEFIVPGNDFEDLMLMAMCKHQIIANSSFSWWGAWLNQNPNKIIIAPQSWANIVLPDHWSRV